MTRNHGGGRYRPRVTKRRAIIAREVPDIPAPVFSTMGTFLDQSLSAQRVMALLSVFFAGCALLVTAIGLYGTLAYRTARRCTHLQWSASSWPIKRELGSRYMDQNLATWALLVALRFKPQSKVF
jgi:hypothetical protein